MTPPATITVEQAATLLHIGRGSAYGGVRRGEIPAVRVGRRILVPVGALAERFSIPPDLLAERLGDLGDR
jgi:excisionase family DNA binding protein